LVDLDRMVNREGQATSDALEHLESQEQLEKEAADRRAQMDLQVHAGNQPELDHTWSKHRHKVSQVFQDHLEEPARRGNWDRQETQAR